MRRMCGSVAAGARIQLSSRCRRLAPRWTFCSVAPRPQVDLPHAVASAERRHLVDRRHEQVVPRGDLRPIDPLDELVELAPLRVHERDRCLHRLAAVAVAPDAHDELRAEGRHRQPPQHLLAVEVARVAVLVDVAGVQRGRGREHGGVGKQLGSRQETRRVAALRAADGLHEAAMPDASELAAQDDVELLVKVHDRLDHPRDALELEPFELRRGGPAAHHRDEELLDAAGRAPAQPLVDDLGGGGRARRVVEEAAEHARRRAVDDGGGHAEAADGVAPMQDVAKRDDRVGEPVEVLEELGEHLARRGRLHERLSPRGGRRHSSYAVRSS